MSNGMWLVQANGHLDNKDSHYSHTDNKSGNGIWLVQANCLIDQWRTCGWCDWCGWTYTS